MSTLSLSVVRHRRRHGSLPRWERSMFRWRRKNWIGLPELSAPMPIGLHTTVALSEYLRGQYEWSALRKNPIRCKAAWISKDIIVGDATGTGARSIDRKSV